MKNRDRAAICLALEALVEAVQEVRDIVCTEMVDPYGEKASAINKKLAKVDREILEIIRERE